MRKYWRQVVTLILIATVMPELFSGNNPITQFIVNPVFVFWAVFLGYGIPVLLIREIVIRKNFGLLSLFLFGLVYGFFNEGILAKTLLMNQGSPVGSYDGMISLFSINWALTGFIVVWHAVASVMAPIFLTHVLFPQTAGQSWLSIKTEKTWLLIIAIISLVFYAIHRPENINLAQSDLVAPLLAILVSMLIFTLLSFKLKKYISLIESRVKPATAVVMGFLFSIFHMVGGGLLAEGAQNTIIVLVFDIILVLMIFSTIVKLRLNTYSNITLFILGHYIFTSLGVIFWAGNPIVVVTNTLGIIGLLGFSIILSFKNWKNKFIN